MPRVRCWYVDCLFLDNGYCTASRIELDPEEGCLTYRLADEDIELGEEEELEEAGYEIEEFPDDDFELFSEDDWP